MTINQIALDCIRLSNISGETIANTFAQLLEKLDKAGDQGGMLVLTYVPEDQLGEPNEGELVPSLTLTLKPYHTTVWLLAEQKKQEHPNGVRGNIGCCGGPP